MEENKREPKPHLGATLLKNFAGGAVIGALAAYVSEDTLEYVQSSLVPFAYHAKLVFAGLGGAVLSTFAGLQYFNNDEHEGRLVIKVAEKEKIPQRKETVPYPGLEEIAKLTDDLAEGVHNRGLANQIYKGISQNLRKSPLAEAQRAYFLERDGFISRKFEVFVPFEYEGRKIHPKKTLDDMFSVGRDLHRMIVNRVSAKAKALRGEKKSPFNRGSEHQEWSEKFQDLLREEIELMKDAALWAAYLSKRKGIVGYQVRGRLWNLGITMPDCLADDVETLGKNILQLYEKIDAPPSRI